MVSIIRPDVSVPDHSPCAKVDQSNRSKRADRGISKPARVAQARICASSQLAGRRVQPRPGACSPAPRTAKKTARASPAVGCSVLWPPVTLSSTAGRTPATAGATHDRDGRP